MRTALAFAVLCVFVLNASGEDLPDQMSDPYSCPEVCADVFDSVCATMNGRYSTFGSECQLLRYNCQNKQNWVKVSHSACPASQ